MEKSRRFREITRLIILLMVFGSTTGHWWTSSRPGYLEKLRRLDKTVCRSLAGLSQNQRPLCERYIDHMQYVSEGAQIAVRECQHQFHGRRWNCSTTNNDNLFGKVLKVGSKETAFAYALAASGAAYTVGRACKNHKLPNCGCSNQAKPAGLRKDWKWAGCGDDTTYAYGFTREYVDARERDTMPTNRRERAIRAMNLHNNEAGRAAVLKVARPSCKCHGVSGSCSLKTCWMHVPDFREIGDRLMQEYNDATKIRLNSRGKVKARNPTDRLDISSLVFIEPSIDYCFKNKRLGITGTKGRECNADSSGDDSCGVLCCSRGHTSIVVEVIERCHCKFQWCCVVKCQKCKTKVLKHICN